MVGLVQQQADSTWAGGTADRAGAGVVVGEGILGSMMSLALAHQVDGECNERPGEGIVVDSIAAVDVVDSVAAAAVDSAAAAAAAVDSVAAAAGVVDSTAAVGGAVGGAVGSIAAAGVADSIAADAVAAAVVAIADGVDQIGLALDIQNPVLVASELQSLDQTTSDQLETHFEQLVLDISMAFGETKGLLYYYHLKQNLVKPNQDHQLVPKR